MPCAQCTWPLKKDRDHNHGQAEHRRCEQLGHHLAVAWGQPGQLPWWGELKQSMEYTLWQEQVGARW